MPAPAFPERQGAAPWGNRLLKAVSAAGDEIRAARFLPAAVQYLLERRQAG